MTIKTCCHSCQRTFQVGDEFACLQVTCPNCGAQQRVTSTLQRGGDSTDSHYSAPPKSRTAYLPKAQSFAGMTPTKIRIRPVLGRCFRTFKKNFGTLLIMEVIQIAVLVVLEIIRDVLLAAQQATKVMDLSRVLGAFVTLFSILFVVTFVWLFIGKIRICLCLLREERTQATLIFSGGGKFVSLVLVLALQCIPTMSAFALAVYFGSEIVLVVGLVIGFLVGLYFWPSAFFVVDNKASVIKSLVLAPRFTDINYFKSFLFYVIFTALPWLGLLAFCIGQLVTVPFAILFACGCYLSMTGQLPAETEAERQV